MNSLEGKVVFLKRQLRETDNKLKYWEARSDKQAEMVKRRTAEINRLKSYIKELKASGVSPKAVLTGLIDPEFQTCYDRAIEYINGMKDSQKHFPADRHVWFWQNPGPDNGVGSKYVEFKVLRDPDGELDLEFVQVVEAK